MNIILLDRYPKQGIIINNNVYLNVTKIKPNGEVRLGFQAEPGIEIWREEIYLKKNPDLIPWWKKME